MSLLGVKAHLTLIKARGAGLQGTHSHTWVARPLPPGRRTPGSPRHSIHVPLHCANPLYPRLPDTGLIWMKIIFVRFRLVADGSPCTWERGFVNTASVKSAAPCLSITDLSRCRGLRAVTACVPAVIFQNLGSAD